MTHHFFLTGNPAALQGSFRETVLTIAVALLAVLLAVAAVLLYCKTRILEKQVKSLMKTNDSTVVHAQETPSSSQEPQASTSPSDDCIYANAEAIQGLALENLGQHNSDTRTPECSSVYTAVVMPEQIYTQLQTPRGEAGTGRENAYALRPLRR